MSKEGAGDSLPLLTPSSDLQNSRLPRTQRRSFEATFFTSTSRNRRPRVRQPLPILRWTTCPWNPTGKLQPWGTSPGSPIQPSDRAGGKSVLTPWGRPSALSPVPSADFRLSDAPPYSILGQVGRQLALIGDDINRRYDTEFQNLLEQLQPTAGNAYELFTKIASRYLPAHSPPRRHVKGSPAEEWCQGEHTNFRQPNCNWMASKRPPDIGSLSNKAHIPVCHRLPL